MSRKKRDLEREAWLRAIGQAIRARREALGISQEELGYRSGLHRTYVSDLERGKRNPTLVTLLSLMTELGGQVSELIQDAESRT